MKRSFYLYIIGAVCAAVLAAAVVGASGTDRRNKSFLNGYGWETERGRVECAAVKIPKPLGEVYERYNEMQVMAGLDLRPYKGRCGIRYTYIVTNFPLETEEEIRANVLCIGGKPVGGDIMTVSATGFMTDLNYLRREGGNIGRNGQYAQKSNGNGSIIH